MPPKYYAIRKRAKTVKDTYELLHKTDEQDDLIQVVGPKAAAPTRNNRSLPRMEQTRDEIIKLVQRLFSSTGAETPQVVIFSAVEQGAGCSWVCARVAEIVAAHVEGPVCLIDANFHSPSIKRHFETASSPRVPDERGLPSPVRRNVERSEEGNLWLLSFRPPAGDWQTPVSLDRLKARLAELRKDFAVILIDAPPLDAYTDAALLGRMGDGVVMVLEANNTRREAAQRGKETLDAAGVRVLGAVLNKRTFPVPEFLYRRL